MAAHLRAVLREQAEERFEARGRDARMLAALAQRHERLEEAHDRAVGLAMLDLSLIQI